MVAQKPTFLLQNDTSECVRETSHILERYSSTNFKSNRKCGSWRCHVMYSACFSSRISVKLWELYVFICCEPKRVHGLTPTQRLIETSCNLAIWLTRQKGRLNTLSALYYILLPLPTTWGKRLASSKWFSLLQTNKQTRFIWHHSKSVHTYSEQPHLKVGWKADNKHDTSAREREV